MCVRLCVRFYFCLFLCVVTGHFDKLLLWSIAFIWPLKLVIHSFKNLLDAKRNKDSNVTITSEGGCLSYWWLPKDIFIFKNCASCKNKDVWLFIKVKECRQTKSKPNWETLSLISVIFFSIRHKVINSHISITLMTSFHWHADGKKGPEQFFQHKVQNMHVMYIRVFTDGDIHDGVTTLGCLPIGLLWGL